MSIAVAGDGTRLDWEESGPADAPPLVFVHSLGTDRRIWRSQIDSLRDAYRVVAFDLRGHGSSQVPAGPYTLDDLGTDLMAVADTARLDRFHLCGVSIGGQVALWAGVHHPDRLRSLIVSNSAARIGTPERWAERIELVRNRGMAAIAEDLAGGWFTPGFDDRHPDRWAEAVEVFRRTDPEGYIGCCAALAGADLRTDVESIRTPTLIVGGEHDLSIPPAEAERLHGRIGGSRLEILESTAHLSGWERPEAFTAVLADFVEGR